MLGRFEQLIRKSNLAPSLAIGGPSIFVKRDTRLLYCLGFADSRLRTTNHNKASFLGTSRFFLSVNLLAVMKARGCFTRNFSSSSSYLGTASSSARTHLNAFRTSSYAATLVTPLISATGKSSLRSTKAFLAVGTTSAPVRGFESVPVASTPSMGR